jgi:uncharacterized protein (TIGR02996 family)
MTAAPPAAVPPLPAPYLRAVLAHPEDDGPRLVAADWWDEQGAAGRAEFVRVQCELATWPHGDHCLPDNHCVHCPDPPRHETLRRRERELLAGSRGKWFDFPITWYVGIDPVPVGAHGFQYRRGFFEVAALTAADFLRHAEALRAACPLRRVRLTTWPEVWAAPRDPRKQVKTDADADAVFGFGPARLGGMYAAAINPGSTLVDQLLTERFPGIDFELPPIADVWHVPRGADPRPIAAPHEGTSG